MLIDPISHISTNYNEYKQAEASLKRLNILNEQPIERENKNINNFDNFEGNIEFRNVSFEYKKDNKVLKNINLTIKKGEVTAFVGSSELGKVPC